MSFENPDKVESGTESEGNVLSEKDRFVDEAVNKWERQICGASPDDPFGVFIKKQKEWWEDQIEGMPADQKAKFADEMRENRNRIRKTAEMEFEVAKMRKERGLV